MKLEIGMYVRTKCGIAKIIDIICGQDIKFDNDNIFENNDDKTHHMYDGVSKNDYFFKHEIVGEPSFDIIDLIESGDYVNGEKVLETNCNWEYIDDDSDTGVNEVYDGLQLEKNRIYFEYEIQSIVTKEQFEKMSYKIGGHNE